MSELVIKELSANVAGTPMLKGVNLKITSGEVHAIMGPNGAGKSTLSHVLMGKPGYEVTGGSVTLDGHDVLAMETWERAQAGLFLAMQYPTEVPGVSMRDVMAASIIAGGGDVATLERSLAAEADRIGFGQEFLERALNVDFSGGEKKRNETMQMGVLKPKIAILDELDSGLDVDALEHVSARVEVATNEDDLGVLLITHCARLLSVLKPDFVHVLADGRIAMSGGPELAHELEETGYAGYAEGSAKSTAPEVDPFADPLT
jgi:Fe-S cluster assembly ATP-binding protein